MVLTEINVINLLISLLFLGISIYVLYGYWQAKKELEKQHVYSRS